MRTVQFYLMIVILLLSATLGHADTVLAQRESPPQDGATAVQPNQPSRGSVEQQMVDSIAGATNTFDLNTYQRLFKSGWGTTLCIAPWENLNAKNCTTMQLINEPNQPGFYHLTYYMDLNNTGNGTYSYRGKSHGMWLGQPCAGGWVKNFVYPQAPIPPATTIQHIENVDPIPSLPSPTTPDGKLIPGWPFIYADC